jgi:hypothetical protein
MLLPEKQPQVLRLRSPRRPPLKMTNLWGFGVSHPFRKEREKDGARGFCGGADRGRVGFCGFPGLKIGISTPRTKTCPWGPRTWGNRLLWGLEGES